MWKVRGVNERREWGETRKSVEVLFSAIVSCCWEVSGRVKGGGTEEGVLHAGHLVL